MTSNIKYGFVEISLFVHILYIIIIIISLSTRCGWSILLAAFHCTAR